MRRRHIKKDKILLVNITRLGDMIQATPTIAGMKIENPNCHISVLVEKSFAEVCAHIPNVDEVIPLDLSMCVQAIAREGEGIIDAYEYFDGVIKKLRDAKYDFCLNMSNSAYTALLIRLAGIERMGGWVSDAEGYRRIESDWARLFAANLFFGNRHFNGLNLVDIFRASADVEAHPESLVLTVDAEASEYARDFLKSGGVVKEGAPLIAIQVGASQEKRQWAPRKFSHLIELLHEKLGAQVVLTGTKAELPLIERVLEEVVGLPVLVAAGKTNIPQLAAVLNQCDLLVTGDTGTMHVAVAVNVPVVALFLASAFCFETGPYSAGNIVIQPTIECGPCNPNKSCSRPDCHDTVSPELVAELVSRRLRDDWSEIPAGLVNWRQAVVYRSDFDEHGFLDFLPLNPIPKRSDFIMREVYRRLWVDDIGGEIYRNRPKVPVARETSLIISDNLDVEQLAIDVATLAKTGQRVLDQLCRAVDDPSFSGPQLGELNDALNDIDRQVEELGLTMNILGPLARMFIFARENLVGTDVMALSQQMKQAYIDLERRGGKLFSYYRDVIGEYAS
jgi:ADP-heptose:LPS heptosyltransferase